jgi:protein-S-isoprenylcysteine O-methyltransferase Ste14
MALKEEFEKTGNWLFRHRSRMPLLMIGIILVFMRRFHYLENSEMMDGLWEGLCFSVSFLGLAIRIKTIGHTPKGTSGRNTSSQIAEALNTTGMYSIVRHPLYLGNFLIWMGISLFPHQWELIVICALSFWLYYERIMFAEESYLSGKYGNEFEEWAGETPAFVPDLRKWRKPELPFSLRNVLKREYNGFFVIILSMSALEMIGNLFTVGKLEFDLTWKIILTAGCIIWMTLRFLKRKTLFLHVEGR